MDSNAISARKMISGLFLLTAALVVTYLKGDLPPNLSAFMQILYGAFVAGNAFEHYTVMKVGSQNNDKT